MTQRHRRQQRHFVIRTVIPGLKRIGVQDQPIRTMTVDTPKRLFDGA
jgi:predicted metal-dependent phosphotriesterase family hydrolase